MALRKQITNNKVLFFEKFIRLTRAEQCTGILNSKKTNYLLSKIRLRKRKKLDSILVQERSLISNRE